MEIEYLKSLLETFMTSGAAVTCGVLIYKGLKYAVVELVAILTRTLVKVESLDKRLTEVVNALGDVQKIRSDLNGYYSRLKIVEEKLEEKGVTQ